MVGIKFPTLHFTYPWRCLCRLSTQITLTLPWRRIILQFRQIFLTEALTFIIYKPRPCPFKLAFFINPSY